ncbi:MAG: hypothetical protein ACPG5U_05100 [Planktomarina sp.]
MNKKAIIVGSAPISETLCDCNLSLYYKIALNHAWKLRDDFDAHVFLDSLPDEDRPPADYDITRISRNVFRRSVNKAGGNFVTTMTAATSAGYWSIYTGGPQIVSYYGCDMVYGKGTIPNHFYGTGGDTGPLLNKFIFNIDYPQKYARLFVYGLFNRTLMLNGSGQIGTQLSLPVVKLGDEFPELCPWVLKHPKAQAILRRGTDALIAETNLMTPVFSERMRVFNNSDEAKEVLEEISLVWAPVAQMLTNFQPIIQAMVAQKSPEPEH